jgi:hypothetical protein
MIMIISRRLNHNDGALSTLTLSRRGRGNFLQEVFDFFRRGEGMVGPVQPE